MDDYCLYDDVNVQNHFYIVGRVTMKNGCCNDKDVIVTKTKGIEPPVYSCQCACVGWCTTGLSTISEALNHYERMSKGENVYDIDGILC